ncbi:DUF885 domain-containing protein [Thiohalobacter sp. IOR34]|uniref:DUF885 domain-containing protein n=1 Tax=Thiohalobacter sp. IOR34 TaxID=3057176 RepID=UPI0025B02AFE|nr:DUF885 domain-containing protein [Thiohalobacter sp. IOR34]WJW75850.1 DUF885 domain-containing protein [Thiohalobacter sp. IOR34]
MTQTPDAVAFDRLVESFYHAWFRFHPELAVELGVFEQAGRLTPCDSDDIGALIALNEKLLAELETIDPEALDADRRLDYRLLQGQATLEHHELLERDWRRRDPQRFLPLDAIHQLTLLPVPDFAAAFASRVGAVSAYLRGCRAHLLQMPELVSPLWLETTLQAAASGAVYLRGLERHPRVQQAFRGDSSIHAALEQGAHAVEDYARFLETEIAPRAAGDFACGRALFEERLRRQHFLPLDADRLHAFGSRLFEETAAALKAVTRELRGDEDVAAQLAAIQADHPAPEELLDCYRTQMRAARRFLVERELISLPQAETLEVMETPPFLRPQIPFAAYLPPVPGDPRQTGHYYVTPARDAASLGEHNHLALKHTCVHEAWPGHHLQFVTANLTPSARSWPRLVNASATLYEGWALYAEQLMQEQGFLAGPESRFLLLRDRLWRALRIQLDVELHCRGLTLEAAAGRMQQALGFVREQALDELRWYTRAPTVPMGYATGWALINAAREQSAGGLRAFHDRLLSAGSPALPLVLERVFGTALRDAVQATLFDG